MNLACVAKGLAIILTIIKDLLNYIFYKIVILKSLLLNSADYCIDTISALEEKLQEKADQEFKAQIGLFYLIYIQEQKLLLFAYHFYIILVFPLENILP